MEDDTREQMIKKAYLRVFETCRFSTRYTCPDGFVNGSGQAFFRGLQTVSNPAFHIPVITGVKKINP